MIHLYTVVGFFEADWETFCAPIGAASADDASRHPSIPDDVFVLAVFEGVQSDRIADVPAWRSAPSRRSALTLSAA